MKWNRVGLFVLVMLFFGTTSTLAYESNLRPFPDVKENDWAKDYIYSLSITGSITGYPDSTFQPDGQLTREAFIHLLVQAAKIKPSQQAEIPVKDVSSQRWSYPSISAAYQMGLIDFMIDKQEIKPAQPITREEVAAMVGKYLLSQQDPVEQTQWVNREWKQEMGQSSFIDQGKMKEALKPFVYLTVKQEIVVGDQAGTFRPIDLLKRKEAAAIIYRLIDQSIQDRSLEMLGFYAIRSYPQIDKIAQLDQVDVAWSELNYTGSGEAELDLTSGFYKMPDGWEEVIKLAQSHSVKRDLMIFNNQDYLASFLQDEKAVESFISKVTEWVNDENYHFTGVTIDFENLKSEQSQKPLVDFLSKMKKALGDKNLSVAVPPTMYYKGYDLQGIGKLADFVVLMAYDFTHGSSGLPSAPLPLVKETIEKTLVSIPKEKLILGISKQANQWTTSPSGQTAFEPNVGIDKVEDRLKAEGVSRTFSMPFFLSKINFSDSRGQHVIWYEDTASIQKKLWLARYFGLHGVSLWYMGNFTDEDWSMLRNEQDLYARP